MIVNLPHVPARPSLLSSPPKRSVKCDTMTIRMIPMRADRH
jgi:hypothetical protein